MTEYRLSASDIPDSARVTSVLRDGESRVLAERRITRHVVHEMTKARELRRELFDIRRQLRGMVDAIDAMLTDKPGIDASWGALPAQAQDDR